MEKVEIKVLNNVKKDAIRSYELFLWRLEEEKNDLKESTLVFSRDDQVSYYPELVRLEKQFNKVYSIPGWASYVLIGIALVYVSVMAILWLTHVITLDKSYFAIAIAVPTGVLLLINVLFTYLRNKQLNNFLNTKEERYKKYQEKVNQLMSK